MENTTSQVNPLRKAVYISTGVLYLIASLLTTVANGILLFAIYKDPYKCFRKPFTVLLAGLAVTDFLVGCLTDCMWAVEEFYFAQGREQELINLKAFLGYFIDNSATLLILALAADRFIAVAFPLYYRSSVRPTRALAGVFCIWSFSAIFASLQFTAIPRVLYDTIDSHLHITVAFILMGTLYGTIYWIVRRKSRQISPGSGTEENQASKKTLTSAQLKRQQREKELLTTAFLIMLCLLLSQTPYLVIVIIESNCESCINSLWYFVFKRYADFLLCITSVVNPYLYGWRVRQFRDSLVAALFGRDVHVSETNTST